MVLRLASCRSHKGVVLEMSMVEHLEYTISTAGILFEDDR